MSRLIINADDFGYSAAVNRAVADLHGAGLVTSASLLVNMPHSEEAAALVRSLPGLSVGVHLNLTVGRPLLPARQVPSLVNEEGSYLPAPVLYGRMLSGIFSWQEAAAELGAQVEWALARGLRLDNLDSHMHFHMLPAARRLTLQLAQRYDVPAWRSPAVLSTLMPLRLWTDLLATPPRRGQLLAPDYLLSLRQWGDRLLIDQRIARLVSQPGVVTELVVHPGYADDQELPLPDQLTGDRRQAELDLVAGVRFRQWLQRLNLKLISFADLGAERSSMRGPDL
jgi:predicted glycoside hydrolase/deacetylase ChbG (UPF0249 family)